MRKIFPTILSHVAAWAAFLSIPALILPRPGPQLAGLPNIPEPPEPARALFVISLNLLLICFFYFNYYVLIPRFWTERRRWQYFLSIVTCFLLLQVFVFSIFNFILPWVFSDAYPAFFHGIGTFASFVMFILAWAASSGIRLSLEWHKAEERHQQSENARLNAELLQLKSQLNPHFLFNTLNGIYTLALAKNDAAPDAVLKLSHLLRYVMSEANADFVPLERDIEHLRHFVTLHQMRLTAQTPVEFKVEGNPVGHQIAPLLLLPFVENALKFGSSTRELSPITVWLNIQDNGLEFNCRNFIRNASGDSTGIGISNTRRRLELLYPGHFSLKTTDQAGFYEVALSIDFQPIDKGEYQMPTIHKSSMAPLNETV